MQFGNTATVINGAVTVSGAVTVTSGTVSITGTTTITGAVNITAGTIDLTLLTQQGVAGQIQIAGAPPIDQETRLQPDVGMVAGINNFGPYDISKSNSLAVSGTNGATGVVRYTLTFYSAANVAAPRAAEAVFTYNFEVSNTSLSAYLQIPAFGNCVTMQTNVTGLPGGANWVMSGSTRTLTKPILQFLGGQVSGSISASTITANNDGEFSLTGTLGASGSFTIVPMTTVGPTTVTIANGAGGAITYGISTVSGISMANGTIAASTSQVITLPAMPQKNINVQINNSSAVAHIVTVAIISMF